MESGIQLPWKWTVRFSPEHVPSLIWQEVSWRRGMAAQVQLLFLMNSEAWSHLQGSTAGWGGRILLYCNSCIFFTCGCKGHRIERIQKYSTCYVKKLTARVCFSQDSYKVKVLFHTKCCESTLKKLVLMEENFLCFFSPSGNEYA